MELDIRVGDETVECYRGDTLAWTVRLKQIVLLAEYTTNEGPADDWFLVLWEIQAGALSKVEIVVDGNADQSVLTTLSGIHGCSVDLKLVQSTDWRSRVVWPPELLDAKYFTLAPIYDRGMWAWFKRKLLGPPLSLGLTDRVRAYLDGSKAAPTETTPLESHTAHP